MQYIRRVASVFGLMALAATGHLSAQDPGSIAVHAYGGGVHNLGTMHPTGVYDTKFGTGFGGGLAYQVSDVFSVRADGYFTKSTITYFGDDQADKLDRLYASLIAKLQLREGTLRPYFLLGAGGTFIKQPTTVESKPKFAHFLGGAGVEYPIGSAGLSFFAESRVAMYNSKALIGNQVSVTRFMADAALTGGFAYRIR
ncbi:MAG: outer membrane beta-barrel protein [Gemmatimonadales bacterium]|nr:outer membrane beta-barrel protein [Gemmatimonadales bacterium]